MSLQASLASRCIYIVREKHQSTNEPHSLCLFSFPSGAFSNVYKAFDLDTKREVAVKAVRKLELNQAQVCCSVFWGRSIRCIGTRMSLQRVEFWRQSGWKVTHMGSCLICFESL